MPTETLLIHELAERAGTTVRTIRYYTDEGLLPQPEIQGKYAYYTQDHLNRLELIRRMKDSYLPLREIGQIMNSLSEAEVLQRLQERTTSPEKPPQGLGNKALEYISRVMDEQSVYRPQGTAISPRSPRPQGTAASPRSPRPGNQSGQLPLMSHPPAQPGAVPEGETWQRIALASGVELCLRQPTDVDTASRVRQLIRYAKKLFS